MFEGHPRRAVTAARQHLRRLAHDYVEGEVSPVAGELDRTKPVPCYTLVREGHARQIERGLTLDRHHELGI